MAIIFSRASRNGRARSWKWGTNSSLAKGSCSWRIRYSCRVRSRAAMYISAANWALTLSFSMRSMVPFMLDR